MSRPVEQGHCQAPFILPAGQLHVWIVPLEGFPADCWQQLLDEPERERYRRFTHRAARTRFVAGRAAIRCLLGEYFPDTARRDWYFEIGPHGRPRIAAPLLPCQPAFNIAHSGDCVAVAVSLGEDPGIDIEDTWRSVRRMDVARRFFSRREYEALTTLPVDRQVRRFFSLWTLKEAWVKAGGQGMRIPLSSVSFGWREGGRIAVAFDPGLSESPADWQFWQFTAMQRYRVAAAIRRSTGAAWHLSIGRLELPRDPGQSVRMEPLTTIQYPTSSAC